MVFLILGAIIILIIVLLNIIRCKIQIALKLTPQDKCIKIIIQIQQLAFIENLIAFHKNDDNQLEFKYYKNGELISSYLLREFIEQIKQKKSENEVNITNVLAYFLDKKKTIFERIAVYVDIGYEDAATTAILAGLLQAGLNIALIRLYALKGKPHAGSIKINPFFQKNILNLHAEAVFSIKLFYAILATIQIFFNISKQKKKNKQQKIKQDNNFKNSL